MFPYRFLLLAALALGMPAPRAECPGAVPDVPNVLNKKLPDPFTMIDGSKVKTKAEFACRQRELTALFERVQLGAKPGKPSEVTGALLEDGRTLSITCSERGKMISFTATITYPEDSGGGPFPAIINFGSNTTLIPAQPGVAVIGIDPFRLAPAQSAGSRGRGKFYELYGAAHPAGALTAWAWGVSRVLDALESTPRANIDPRRVGVTGCSRFGKGVLAAGALDGRVALTVPQESGAGGAACWRLYEDERARRPRGPMPAVVVIADENVYFSKSFDKYRTAVDMLPVDQHELAALIVPRGLFVIEKSGLDWLGSSSTYGCQRAAHLVYQAYGAPDAMGYSQVGGHGHCMFPEAMRGQLEAFVKKFLLGDLSQDTRVFYSDANAGFSMAPWVNWSVPTLT